MRRSALLAVLITVAAGLGLVAPAAVAAPAGPTTVTLPVTDSDGDPIAGIAVSGFSERKNARLGRTDAHGDIVAARGRPGHYVGAGSWIFFLDDADPARGEAGTTYVSDDIDATLARGGNDLGTVVLQVGARIEGTVRTPSGTPVSQYLVEVDSDYSGTGMTTDDQGRYSLGGLTVGTYRGAAVPDDDDCCDISGGDRIVVDEPGQVVEHDFVVKVPAVTVSLTGKNSSAGREVLTYSVSARRYGVTDPGGTVSVVVDGNRADPVTQSVVDGKAVLTVDGLSRGSHTFTASYSGPDLTAGRVGITKQVR